MKLTTGKKLAGGFGLALVILLVVNIISYRNTTTLLEDIRLRTQTQEVLSHLKDVLIVMLNAETGQRGYLLTGDQTYLEKSKA
jgi:CHASE3 domain sensor protein